LFKTAEMFLRKIVDALFCWPPCFFNKKQRIVWFLIAAVLFSIQVIPRIWMDSAITDEAWETTSGYYYWLNGDVVSLHNNPPLADALNAFPLLSMHLKTFPHVWSDNENRAYFFYYVANLDKLDWILILPRVVTLFFSLGTGFFIYLFVCGESWVVLVLALLLWAFEPNLLAFSTVAKSDAPFTFFCVGSFYFFLKGQEKKSGKLDFLTGFATGLAMTSKLTGLCLLPIYLVLDLWAFRKKTLNLSQRVQRWMFGIAGFLTAVFFIFLPGTLKLSGHLNPFDYFYLRIKDGLWLSNHFLTSTYFWGQYYPVESWWQFPVIFFMKSTIPFTALLLVGMFGWLTGKIKLPVWIWFFPLAWMIFLQLLPVPYLRYALPAYPAMIFWSARGAEWLWEIGKDNRWRSVRWIVVFAGLWHVTSTSFYFSKQISYLNDFVISDQKFKLLDPHYYDLNQDLKRLGRVSKERHWIKVKLAYAGQDDPYYYGLALWDPWSLNDLAAPQAGTVYVVEREMLVEGSNGFPIHQSWPNVLKPTGAVGDTWYYYEFPGSMKKADKSILLPSTPYLVYQNAPYRQGIK